MASDFLSVKDHKKILLIVTGSVAAYKAIELTSLLAKAGHQVQVLLSRSALHFVGEAAFESLSGRPVLTNLWQSGDLLGHIHWMRWADFVLVAPATAEFIAQLAQGHATDYASTLSLAHQHDKPFFIFPAMNPAMWEHPATQDNVRLLRQRGYLVISPDAGFMACREEGTGRFMDPQHIAEVLFSKSFAKTSLPTGRALVTSGGTRVPIDGVRHLGNFSSGQTGWLLTLELLRMGYQVDWVHARWTWGEPDSKIHLYQRHGYLRRFEFQTPDELESQLKQLLQEKSKSDTRYDLFWHLAAISDFHVELLPAPSDPSDTAHVTQNDAPDSKLNKASLPLSQAKLDSRGSYLMKLLPRRKTLQVISEFLDSSTTVVAWKLTNKPEGGISHVTEKVTQLFQQAHVRYVVHNEWGDYNKGVRLFRIYSRESPLKALTEVSSVSELAYKLETLCRHRSS